MGVPGLDLSHLRTIRARRTGLLAVIAALPVVLAAFAFAPIARSAAEGALLVWVAVYGFAAVRYAFSRCPRCGHLFPSVRGFHNPFARRCRGCGLSLHADEDGVH